MNKILKDWTKRRQRKNKKIEWEKNWPDILACKPGPDISLFSLSSFFPLDRPNRPFSSFSLSFSVMGRAHHFFIFFFLRPSLKPASLSLHLIWPCARHMPAASLPPSFLLPPPSVLPNRIPLLRSRVTKQGRRSLPSPSFNPLSSSVINDHGVFLSPPSFIALILPNCFISLSSSI